MVENWLVRPRRPDWNVVLGIVLLVTLLALFIPMTQPPQVLPQAQPVQSELSGDVHGALLDTAVALNWDEKIFDNDRPFKP